MSMKIEEERELIKKYQQDNCISSRDKLLESQMGIIVNTSKRLTTDFHLRKELVNEGVIGFLQSLSSFDLFYNLRLSAYMGRVVFDRMKRYTRQTSDIMRRGKGEYQIGRVQQKNRDGTRGTSIMDDEESQCLLAPWEEFIEKFSEEIFIDDYIKRDNLNRIYNYLLSLTELKRESFLSGVFQGFEGVDSRQLGLKYGLSKSTISYHAKCVRKKIKKELCPV